MHWFSVFVAIFGLSSASSMARFRLARYYQNNMVLQRAPHNAIVWGYANASNATITLGLRGKEYSTRAISANWSDSPIWRIKLDPVNADNQPVNITIAQRSESGLVNSLELTNVLFGDVWL